MSFSRGFLVAIFSAGVLAFCLWLATRLPPIVPEDMARHGEMLERARQHASEHHWGPREYEQSLQLSSGGSTAYLHRTLGRAGLEALKNKGLYQPFLWCVIHRDEQGARLGRACFTSSGAFHSLRDAVEDTERGRLSPVDALRVARAQMVAFGADASALELKSSKPEEHTSGRIDHHMQFRRVGPEVAGGQFRVYAVVSGDRLSRLDPYFQRPRTVRDEEKRVAAQKRLLGTPGRWWYGWGYALASIGVLLRLGRRRKIRWMAPLAMAAFVGALEVVEVVNDLPHQPSLLDASALWAGCWRFVALAPAFLAVDLLVREFFVAHLDIFRVHQRSAVPGPALWSAVVIGVAAVGAQLLYVQGFYHLTAQAFGWWCPEWRLPGDALGAWIPALTPIARALSAGITEEFLFRGLIIGLGAWAGQRWGGRTGWIVLAIGLQAVLFGTAHAQYAQLPAYARIVELFLPFVLYGIVLVRLGLLPCILAHVLFDLVLMSDPIFRVDGTGMALQRLIIVGSVVAPIALLAALRMRRARGSSRRGRE